MEKRREQQLDLMTLTIYTLLSMVFSVAIIVCAALILKADILTWNPTLVTSSFFALTGGCTALFLLLK